MILSHGSKASALRNVAAIASFAEGKGHSFSPIQKGPHAKAISPRENAHLHARRAITTKFSNTLLAFQQLPQFAREFTQLEGNGVASCAIDEETGQFKYFFLVFDASIEIAMHASMRVVAMDAAHLPNLRRDLRILVLEGVTSNNTIYVIAFMLCWGETIETLKRFFDLLKEHRPIFYNSWLDNEATTLIADRGPGKCFKPVVLDKFVNGASMLRSCVLHVVRNMTLLFPGWMRNNKSLIWSLGTCFDPGDAANLLEQRGGSIQS